jgi:hypothetical protein
MDHKFIINIRVGALGVIWSILLYKIDTVLTMRFLSYTGHLLVYIFASFMVVFTTCGESRPVHGGVYIVGGHSEEYFYTMWMAALSVHWSSNILGDLRFHCLCWLFFYLLDLCGGVYLSYVENRRKLWIVSWYSFE